MKQDKVGVGLGEFAMATMEVKLSIARILTRLQKGCSLMLDSYFVQYLEQY